MQSASSALKGRVGSELRGNYVNNNNKHCVQEKGRRRRERRGRMHTFQSSRESTDVYKS